MQITSEIEKLLLPLELWILQNSELKIEVVYMTLNIIFRAIAFPCLTFDTITQWSKWPKFVSLHYWHAPRGARGVKKSGRPNWSPLWWVWALRFSQNWRNCEILSKLNKIVKETLFSKGFLNFVQFGLNLSAPTY